VTRVIVFDFDGTIVDSNSAKLNGMLNYFSKYLVNTGPIVEMYKEGASRLDIWDRFSYSNNLVNGSYVEFTKSIDDSVIKSEFFDCAIELLFMLQKKGYTLILSSATPDESLIYITKAMGISKYFKFIFGNGLKKIDRLLYIKNTISDNITVIGDGEDDKNSAEGIAVKFIPVNEGRGVEKSSKVYTIREIYQLYMNYNKYV
jgi:phosphoglycolate phosphatase-like HAD superfamily hydrolase